jgi:hypothetical protein
MSIIRRTNTEGEFELLNVCKKEQVVEDVGNVGNVDEGTK